MRIKGSDLPIHLQQEAKRLFVHRFTGEHRPAWSRVSFIQEDGNRKTYPVQFKNDQDWLENTYFILTKDGQRFDARVKYCESYPTWPLNGELRKGK